MTQNTITVPMAARKAGVIVTYLYQLLASGKLKGEKIDGRWVIDETDFERWQSTYKSYRKTTRD
jgi:hypothetical protein